MIYLILIFGTVLRLISLNQSLWLDEATTALAAKMSLTGLFTKFLPGDFHPPLYYLLVKYWSQVFGYSEIALRMPSVIFGVTTMYIVYLIGKKIANSNVGLLAGVFTATSGLLIYYSQEARMYSLVTFLICLVVYAFLRKRWITLATLLALLGMIDYVALLIIPTFFIFAPKVWKKIVICLIPLVLVYIVWLPIFAKQIIGGLVVNTTSPLWWQILGETSWRNLALIPTKFIFGRISIGNKFLYAGLTGLSVLVFGRLMLTSTLSKNPYLKFLWLWLVTPVALAGLIGIKVPILSYFRLIYIIPAMYLLLGVGLLGVKKNIRLIAVGLILLLNTTASLVYLTNSKFQREDWRGASLALGNNLIVLPADSQKEALTYYGKGGQAVYYKNFDGNQSEVWLSRYIWEVFDPNDNASRKLENLGYNKVFEANFNGVVITKYAYRD